jgi:hypothetical protein
MFHHVVTFQQKPETEPSTRRLMIAKIRDLPLSVPGIIALKCGEDFGLAEGNFDVAVCVSFARAEDYQVYATHGAHLAVVAEYERPYLAQRVAIQFVDN